MPRMILSAALLQLLQAPRAPGPDSEQMMHFTLVKIHEPTIGFGDTCKRRLAKWTMFSKQK